MIFIFGQVIGWAVKDFGLTLSTVHRNARKMSFLGTENEARTNLSPLRRSQVQTVNDTFGHACETEGKAHR
eukprot:SAG31_NODE_967_length_10684_cov_58.582239_5_plen_71_part_00